MWRAAMPRWGRHPRLRHMVSPMATPMANEAADRVPAVVTRTGRRRQFSEEDKRRIVEETCRPGESLSAVAAAAELTCAYCSGGGEPWGLADQLRRQASCRSIGTNLGDLSDMVSTPVRG